jgi:hypothetical protein
VPHLSAPIQFLQHLWFAMIATRENDRDARAKLLELLEIARIARNLNRQQSESEARCNFDHARNCSRGSDIR